MEKQVEARALREHLNIRVHWRRLHTSDRVARFKITLSVYHFENGYSARTIGYPETNIHFFRRTSGMHLSSCAMFHRQTGTAAWPPGEKHWSGQPGLLGSFPNSDIDLLCDMRLSLSMFQSPHL